MTVVVGYRRVSTAEQADSGAGLAAQKTAIAAEADRRGYDVRWITDAGESGKSLRRKGIQTALQLLKRGEASGIIVSKLDRLSRSVQDFAAIMALSRKQGWSLIALDLGVDTTTPAGEMVANVMISVSQWERRIIGARTKDALAERRAAGVQLGRPRAVSPEVVARIVAERAAGKSLAKIAAGLDADGVPTPHGAARWYGNTVNRIVKSEARRTTAADVA
jgi:DNA invertase Pin-like site-specific DNA recombinase